MEYADMDPTITDDERLSAVKRKRQPNFIFKEKMELFTIIFENYKDILEDKATDKCSVYDKDKCWSKVEDNFNAVSTTGIFRDKDCLKRCYENRKREVRKLMAKEKQENMKTGGGIPEKVVLDAADEVLLQIMNRKSVVGLENPYDSDFVNDKLVRKDHRKDDEQEYWFNKENIEEDFPSFKKANDLKKSKHSALIPSYISRKNVENNIQDNILPEASNTCYKVDSLNELLEVVHGEENKKSFGVNITSSTEEATHKFTQPIETCTNTSDLDQHKEEQENQKKKKSNSLRGPLQVVGGGRKAVGRGKFQGTKNAPNRRAGIQILASSHIAKKYDELLDQRKILLEKQIQLANEDLTFQRAKNRLELELLKLKIEKKKDI